MDDLLIRNLIRLVRNGRTPKRGCEKFAFGDLLMLDDGPYEADDETLHVHRAKRGFASPIALVVYYKGTMVEIWSFHDFRVPSSASLSVTTGTRDGIILTDAQVAPLSTIVRVIFAYLRIHELFMEMVAADATDVHTRLLLDPNAEDVPRLDADASATRMWAVEGLVSVRVTHNRLWRVPGGPPPPASPKLRARPPAPTPAAPFSESAGSGRSMPTPHFAPAAAPGSVGSGRLSASLHLARSPTFGASEIFLPHAAAGGEGAAGGRRIAAGTAALAAAMRGTRTHAVRGHTFTSVPTFAAAAGGSSSEEDDEGESVSHTEELHELLEICEGAALQEASVELFDVLDLLDKKVTDP